MEDRLYDYWVATLQDGYIGKLLSIVERAGGARAFYEMSALGMKEKLGLSDRLIRHIENNRGDRDLAYEYERMMQSKIRYVNHNDSDFPKRLRTISSPPYGLFVKGSLPKEGNAAVAVIGARECSEYGRLMAEYFGSRLGKKGVDIISGMAWGIDGLAQMSAISEGGHSYGILGCGCDIIYPRKNQQLYHLLCENGNGVISEYAPKTTSDSRKFPPRNRIISGLADIVLVVEARAQSGTLITVDMATDQGKTIMIVPGRLTDPLSVGCLNLMKEGAIPALGPECVLEELCNLGVFDFPKGDVPNEGLPTGDVPNEGLPNREVQHGALQPVWADLGDAKKAIMRKIDFMPIGIQTLSDSVSMDISTLLVHLSELEAAGLIKEISPGYFVQNKAYVYEKK